MTHRTKVGVRLLSVTLRHDLKWFAGFYGGDAIGFGTVHLGAKNGTIAAWREALGKSAQIGRSQLLRL